MWVLRFTSGRYEGGSYALQEGRSLVIGRTRSADLPLLDDGVSRQHAKLLWEEGALRIEDLGSTNGTLVNGRTLTRARRLRVGDVIEIGDSRMLVSGPSRTPSRVNRWDSQRTTARRAVQPATPLTGSLEELPLSDLLQSLERTGRSVEIAVVSGRRRGRIILFEGAIIDAALDGDIAGRAEKSLFRMLVWSTATFEVTPLDGLEPGPKRIDHPTLWLLMEAQRQFDESAHAMASLPPLDEQLEVVPSEPAKPLDPVAIEVLALAREQGSIAATVAASMRPDGEVLTALLRLHEAGSLRSTGKKRPRRALEP